MSPRERQRRYTLQEAVQREGPWTGHGEPHRQDDVGPLFEAEEIGDPVKGIALGREDGDGHDHDQRERSEAAQQAHQEQRSADEFGRRRQEGVEPRSRNAQLGEELGHLVEAVQLAPAGADEDDAERESRQGRPQGGEALSEGEESGLRARDDAHGFAPGKLRNRTSTGLSVTARNAITRLAYPGGTLKGALECRRSDRCTARKPSSP